MFCILYQGKRNDGSLESAVWHIDYFDLLKIQKALNVNLIEKFNLEGNKMAKKFIQKAVKEMERKGTVGTFTAQAKKSGGVKKGGGIKESFIEKELKSKNPTTRKRAQFAKNMKKIARGK